MAPEQATRVETAAIGRGIHGHRKRSLCWPTFACPRTYDILTYARHHPRSPSSCSRLRTSSGVEAIRAGAFDFLTKPLIERRTRAAIQRALNQREVLKKTKPSSPTRSPLRMETSSATTGGCSRSSHDRQHRRHQGTVLITGESGCGKSLVRPRDPPPQLARNKAFVEIACGALPDTLLESELFGHVAAPSPARRDKMGKFMQAMRHHLPRRDQHRPRPCKSSCSACCKNSSSSRSRHEDVHVDSRVILATTRILPRPSPPAVPPGFVLPRERDQHRTPTLRERISTFRVAKHFLERVCAESARKSTVLR